MTHPRSLLAVLGVLSATLAVVAMWLMLDNPTVESASLGEYTCTAPYDTVLNDADNVPGGEPPFDADAVEARCIEAGEARFAQGMVAAAAALVMGAAMAMIAVRRAAPKADTPTSA